MESKNWPSCKIWEGNSIGLLNHKVWPCQRMQYEVLCYQTTLFLTCFVLCTTLTISCKIFCSPITSCGFRVYFVVWNVLLNETPFISTEGFMFFPLAYILCEKEWLGMFESSWVLNSFLHIVGALLNEWMTESMGWTEQSQEIMRRWRLACLLLLQQISFFK